MGSKTVGKVLGVSSGTGSTSDSGVQESQYVKLGDGSLTLYDPTKITMSYAEQTANTGAKGQRKIDPGAFGKNSSPQLLESATYDGQNLELSNGSIKLYSQSDYDNWQTQKQEQAQKLKTSTNAAAQNLENARSGQQNNRRQQASIFTTAGSVGGGGGTGVFSGITE